MAANKTNGEKPMPKTAIYKELAAKTGLEAKQVAAVFEALEELAKEELKKKNGPGEFVIPNLIKLKLVKKPATPGGMRKDPFRPGQMMEVKPKPASVKVKPVVLKSLKEIGKT
jgi:nucleoid DNA-binding protein